MITLPCLSLTQPWCEAVLNPTIDKDIENRVWNTHKRGTFLIAASAGMPLAQYTAARYFIATALPLTGKRPEYISLIPPAEECQRGGIVGAAVLLDVLRPVDHLHLVRKACINCELHDGICPEHSAWRMDGQYGFRLGKRLRLPFRAYKGAQRWYNVELTAEEERLLRAANMLEAG